MNSEKQNQDASKQSASISEKENLQRNQGAWNGHVEQTEQDTEKQGGSLATDGPVSEAAAGRGDNLDDTTESKSVDDNAN